MRLLPDQSAEKSRFVLALTLSSATALLVAAPLVIAMQSSSDQQPTIPVEQSSTSETTEPAPALGPEEIEIGRIDESEPPPQSPPPPPKAPETEETQPTTTAAAEPTTTESSTIPDEPTTTVDGSTTTTAAPPP